MIKFFLRILRNADAADGTANVNTPAAEPEGDEAPMARIAVTGQKSEREMQLEVELESERAARQKAEDEKKERELTISQLQDKHENYRKSVEQPKQKKFRLPQPLIGSESEE